MVCLYCKKRIGLLRRITDNQYCCSEHRTAAHTNSARALREAPEPQFYDDDHASTVFVKRLSTSAVPRQQTSPTSSLVFGLFLVGAVFIGSLGLPQRQTQPENSSGATTPQQAVSSFRRMLRAHAAVRLSDDFKSGTSAWMAASGGHSGRAWSIKDGFLRPGALRIWKDSIPLKDYNVEFAGQIEQKALGWAFRATNGRNYYATKLLINRPGPLPAVDLMRYAVVDGAEIERVRLPLPLTVRMDTLYKVHLTVSGSDFTTTVNGQIVDTWSDRRLSSGGVGFFADTGEIASLRYVTVTDRDTFVGRILSHFGMVHPMMLAR